MVAEESAAAATSALVLSYRAATSSTCWLASCSRLKKSAKYSSHSTVPSTLGSLFSATGSATEDSGRPLQPKPAVQKTPSVSLGMVEKSTAQVVSSVAKFTVVPSPIMSRRHGEETVTPPVLVVPCTATIAWRSPRNSMNGICDVESNATLVSGMDSIVTALMSSTPSAAASGGGVPHWYSTMVPISGPSTLL